MIIKLKSYQTGFEYLAWISFTPSKLFELHYTVHNKLLQERQRVSDTKHNCFGEIFCYNKCASTQLYLFFILFSAEPESKVGLIVGLTLGLVCLFVLIAAVIFFVLKR